MMKIFAPAKVNLYLHITGKRADGYHCLESLIAFTDVCDVLQLSIAKAISLQLTGPTATGLPEGDDNIVMKAARALAAHAKRDGLGAHIRLEKNIPSGAGLGGGSADAAAVLRGLNDLWALNLSPDVLARLGLSLGADVPVCLVGGAAHVLGIGEKIEKTTAMPKLPVVLVNCGRSLATEKVYQNYDRVFSRSMPLQYSFDQAELLSYLKDKKNDLQVSATGFVPEIQTVLEVLEQQAGCVFSRMSGSGVTCFGVFKSIGAAKQAAGRLQADYPHWWVRASTLQD